MTSTTPSPAPAPAALPPYLRPQRVTQARVLRSEWTKLRTQPSALWALLSAVILIAGFGILYSLLREARPPHGAAAIGSFDPVAVSLSGVQLAQIAVGVLGVLLITSEYATGLIRTTLAAVPRRLPVLWGKAAMLAAAIVAVSLPAVLAAFLAGQSILAGSTWSVSARPARGGPGGARQRAVPGRGRADRPGPGRAAAQHRGRDRGAVRPAVRPAARGRLPAGKLVSTTSASTCRPRPAWP